MAHITQELPRHIDSGSDSGERATVWESPRSGTRWRWFGGYYLLLSSLILLGLAYGFFFSEIFFPGDKGHIIETIMGVLKLSWLIPLPYALVNFYAYWRYPAVSIGGTTPARYPMKVRLYFRYVTRGLNPHLISENVQCARNQLSMILEDKQWVIEVITDNSLELEIWDSQAQMMVVPSDYLPEKGTKYKGRALQYAMQNSSARPEDWIIHLDEETQFGEHTIRAIMNFISNEHQQSLQKNQRFARIGQGVIVYSKGKIVNWITTLADSVRVADDYGRFRLQFENGKAYFGMHGSFIVINNTVEKMIGFDHGAESSITEDTYFGLVAQRRGVEFQWIDAQMYERSPFTISDFILQRRRWFGGLWLCARTANIPLKERLILAFFMAMWSSSWMCVVMTVINVIYPTGTPLWISLLAGLTFICNVGMYLLGFLKSFSPVTGRFRFMGLLVLQLALIPLFSMMEGAAVIYGLLSPPHDFYVVKKEA